MGVSKTVLLVVCIRWCLVVMNSRRYAVCVVVCCYACCRVLPCVLLCIAMCVAMCVVVHCHVCCHMCCHVCCHVHCCLIQNGVGMVTVNMQDI